MYKSYSNYNLIDSYIFPENSEKWLNCPRCGLKPKVWIFDNGRSTGCGCRKNKYDHFSIWAESIMSIYKNDGGLKNYNSDDLRENWNHWVKTSEERFKHAKYRNDERW